jgi:molecular chaperone GrpE
MSRVMPEQEAELKLMEPEELMAGGEAPEMMAEAGIDPATELSAPGKDEEAASPTESAAAAQAESAGDSVSAGDYEKLKAERDQLLDRLARLQAEFENARKRTERERAEFRDFTTAAAVEKFLPVLDNFELALKANGTAHQLRSGVSLIVKQMEEILRQMQVTPVPAVGEAFDPRIHEALGAVEREDVPDQHVAEEVRRGYRLREKLLRPALVRVASNPKQVSE